MAKRIVHNSIRLGSAPIGQRYGRLVSLGASFLVANRAWQVFECDCGEICVKAVNSVRQGETSSCGCYRREYIGDRSRSHDKTNTKEYRTWTCMKERCMCPNRANYPNYGGKGVTVCDRWLEADGQGFLNFLADMGPKPSTRHSLDRIDVYGNYCPENCRWATPSQQTRNRKCSVYLEHNGKRQTLADWADEIDIQYTVVFSRYKRGLTPSEILDPFSRNYTTKVVRIARNEKNQ